MKRTAAALATLALATSCFAKAAPTAFAANENSQATAERIPAVNMRVVFCDIGQNPYAFNIILTVPPSALATQQREDTKKRLLGVLGDTTLLWAAKVEPQLQIAAKGMSSAAQTAEQLNDPQSPLMLDMARILTSNLDTIITNNSRYGQISYLFTRPTPSTEVKDRQSCGLSL